MTEEERLNLIDKLFRRILVAPSFGSNGSMNGTAIKYGGEFFPWVIVDGKTHDFAVGTDTIEAIKLTHRLAIQDKKNDNS
jgi:hypothetical protein